MQTNNRISNQTNPTNQDLNTQNAYYGRDLVTFKSTPSPSEKTLKANRIKNLIRASLAKIETVDLLVIGNSKNNVKKTVSKYLSNFATPIKGLAICDTPDIDETIMLMKGPDSICRLWNLSDKPIIINAFSSLNSKDSVLIEDGDYIRIGDTWVEFNYEDTESKTTNDIKNFEYYDFKPDLHKFSTQYNTEILKKIFPEKVENKTKQFSFENIGGQDEIIKALKRNILFPLKHPEAFEGFMMNRGAVLYGPPGTGKTLIAKTLGVESNASVFEMCATDMQDKYVGESEKNCRELFKKAVDAQPSIIYLDEFEALGKARGGQDVHGDKLLSQFLSLMSDLEKNNDRVYVIAATNRIEDIDPAILRSGRFALKLEVKQPDLAGTRQILDIHSKGKPMDEKLDYDSIAQKMFAKKMSGADIAVTVKEAASNAFEREGIYKSMEEGRYSPEMLKYFRITSEDFEKAIDNFSSGAKQRNPIGFGK